MTTRSRIGGLHVLALILVGCAGGESTLPAPCRHTNPNDIDAFVFDRLVSPASVLTDPRRRAFSDAYRNWTEYGTRTYTFELRALTGMKRGRHFDIIIVSIVGAGRFISELQPEPLVMTKTGPSGTSIEATLQTFDRCYDVRVAEVVSLPATVSLSVFDPALAVRDIVQRYKRVKARDDD